MKTSPSGLEFIAKWEGTVLKPYRDVAGLRTIGVGHLITPSDNFPDGVAITHEQAMDILAGDVKKCEDAIAKSITVPLTQNQFDALVSFGFNCGVGMYTGGSCQLLNKGDVPGFIAGLKSHNHARINGVLQEVAGLTKRRNEEADLFMTPDLPANFVLWTKPILSDVQTKLQRLGLYTSSIDGYWGSKSDAAIRAFAQQMGIDLVIEPRIGITRELMEALDDKGRAPGT